MNKPKGWYNTVLEIDKELELRKQSKDFHHLDLLVSEQTATLIHLFNECEFVGFSKADTEAETVVSNVLASVQNSLIDKMDFVPVNPFFNLYLGLCYLEKVLQLIKQEYENNLKTSIEHLENIIYQSENYKNLVEVSRSIGRNIINNKQHPDFGILKKHIAEQLEYIEQNDKPVKALNLQQPKPEDTYTPKPCFNPELIYNITKDLNTFFEASQHAELKRIIETGTDTNVKLLFRDNGNKLTDYFKRLFENNTITGCAKKDLINWIIQNFSFIYRKTQKDFIYKTVEKTISGMEQPCKNPIT